jgi:hypothetical protein
MLHPDRFRVNEAWILFKLNDAPLSTEEDGDFDLWALVDAASCFILSTAPVPVMTAEPSQREARQLLKKGQSHKKQLPRQLFIPSERLSNQLAAEAERQGIMVVRVPEADLGPFIDEARESFKERFGGGRTQ